MASQGDIIVKWLPRVAQALEEIRDIAAIAVRARQCRACGRWFKDVEVNKPVEVCVACFERESLEDEGKA